MVYRHISFVLCCFFVMLARIKYWNSWVSRHSGERESERMIEPFISIISTHFPFFFFYLFIYYCIDQPTAQRTNRFHSIFTLKIYQIPNPSFSFDSTCSNQMRVFNLWAQKMNLTYHSNILVNYDGFWKICECVSLLHFSKAFILFSHLKERMKRRRITL